MNSEKPENFSSDPDELDRRAAELDAREQQVQQKEEAVKRRMRDNLYDRINVTVPTMNKFIAVIAVLLVMVIVYGVLQGGGG